MNATALTLFSGFARVLSAFSAAALIAALNPAASVAAEERIPADIGRVIQTHRGDVTDIYNTYLDAGLEITGTVVVRFTIARSGTVTESAVAESDTGCKLFDEAVAAAVKSWAFGPAGGEPVTVRYPFTFTFPSEAETSR